MSAPGEVTGLGWNAHSASNAIKLGHYRGFISATHLYAWHSMTRRLYTARNDPDPDPPPPPGPDPFPPPQPPLPDPQPHPTPPVRPPIPQLRDGQIFRAMFAKGGRHDCLSDDRTHPRHDHVQRPVRVGEPEHVAQARRLPHGKSH